MNAFEVATPASIVAGSSAIGSSAWPLTARLRPMSIALSPSVAARHSRIPVSSDRSAAGDDPVPGLLNDRNVVVPPNAAATESWKNRSGLGVARDAGVRVDVDHPGSTSSPVASTTSSAPARSPERSGSTTTIRPLSTARSARLEPVAATTVLPRTRAPSRRDDRPAAGIAAGHAITPPRGSRSPARPPTGNAGPSRAVGRPSRRRRSTVAKWLAASWPTFDAVVHPPYGKKISHSLMPPG